ncbi:MAG: exosortase/archaeosortase family protein [Phycisphaerales bacterium]|nr:exosortase/archaeosortase family protein [Phycisphaerales bacterium]
MNHSQAAVAFRPVSRASAAAWALMTALVAALTWSHWSVITGLFREWRRDPNYSVGQLVPIAALYLVWTDRHRLKKTPLQPCWWGAAVILVAWAGRAIGLISLFESAERYALVLTVWGLVLLVTGWPFCRKLVWILLFLLLMVPLPGRIHNMISGPLQDHATTGAVFGLELIGIAVNREGHRILLDDTIPINVAEECSGLRMLTAFVVVAATLAYVIRRPRWQKVVLLVSSIPIAIACNVFRLVVTAVLFWMHHSELGARFFHDFAGVSMMPASVLILLIELWIMSKLVVPDAPQEGTLGADRIANIDS